MTDARQFTICELSVNHGCIGQDLDAMTKHPLPYFHAARIEAASFAAGIAANPQDLSPITDDEIEQTGLID